MTVLVTGGAGFIGANFIFYQLTHHPEDRVVCLDKLTYAGNLETLADVMENPNFRFVQGDIADAQAVERLFLQEKPDYVVNFAAESHVDRSITQPDLFLKTNVLGTGVLLDACRRHGITRYHQVSTDEVYGDLPLDRPDLFFTEETPIHTSSPYSASKAGADLLVLAYARTYGLPVTVSRCSNNYGPYHFPEKLIPLMITRALADQSLPVYGTGENVRDWLYVLSQESFPRSGSPAESPGLPVRETVCNGAAAQEAVPAPAPSRALQAPQSLSAFCPGTIRVSQCTVRPRPAFWLWHPAKYCPCRTVLLLFSISHSAQAVP